MNTSGNSASYDASRTQYSDEEKVLISVCCGKGDSTRVGMSILNLANSSLILNEFTDSQAFSRTIHMISLYNCEVIIPSSSIEDKFGTILASNTKFTRIKLKFDLAEDLEFLRLYAVDKNCLLNLFDDKKLAINAGSLAIKFVIGSTKYSLNKLRIFFKSCESYMLIDSRSIKQLELIENHLNGNSGTSLYKILDNCNTKMGQKLLKANISQPLTDKIHIELRLKSVRELKMSHNLSDIRSLLSQYQNLERLFNTFINSALINPEDRINNVLILKDSITITSAFPPLFTSFKSELLVEISSICSNSQVSNVGTLINEYINLDCQRATGSLNIKNQKAYAVKSGKNGLLDVSRNLYKSLYDNVISMVESLSIEHNIIISYHFDASRGFYLKIKCDSLNLPLVFINKIKKRNIVECTTIDLMKFSSRFREINNEIISLSDTCISELYSLLSEYVSPLFMVSEAIATLDLLCCFAYNSNNALNVYIMPQFSNFLRLKNSRHVMLESIIGSSLVPNDYTGEIENSRFHLIAGSNMSGKSVYLRQICYLVIMAQIGSFVPAEYAVLPIFKNLHTRIGSDNEDSTISLFSREMTDMANIINEVNEDSLIIIDELGRGSSLTDGFAISLAISEHLLKTRAIVFMSTHFHDLAQILGSMSGFDVSHMRVDVDDNKLTMRYKIEKGQEIISGYGLKYAESSKLLPQKLIEDAKKISLDLRSLSKDQKQLLHDRLLVSKRQKLNNQFMHALNAAKDMIGKKDDAMLVQALLNMKKRYIEERNKLA